MIDTTMHEQISEHRENGTDEKEQQLIPFTPPPQCEPAEEPAAPPRRGLSHLFTFVCAVFCILTVTVAGINLAVLAGRTSTDAIALRLANRTLLGLGTLTIRAPGADTLPLPPVDLSDNGTADAPDNVSDDTPPDSTAAEETPSIPADRYPIAEADVSSEDIHTLFNETTYQPDTAALLAAALPFPVFPLNNAGGGTEEPYILILHTHGTEAFSPEGSDTYAKEDTFRSANTEENIVAVGAVMADTFREAGIPVLHCTEMFDRESYQDSYSRAAAAIRAYLLEYPSIQIVLDVHRDSIIRADMTKIRPVTTVDGASVAQFMIVAGTDFKGANHPDWEKNLSFALKIQENLTARAERFTRAINLRGAGFNQQYTHGSLLLEVGSCGNTLTEAKRAGALAAIAIADVVTDGNCTLTLSDIFP